MHGRAERLVDVVWSVSPESVFLVGIQCEALDRHRQARATQRRRQTAAHFDRLEQRVDAGFAEMRAKFDQTAAGMAQIVDLLTTATTSSSNARPRDAPGTRSRPR